jgi:hypothetical protein
LVEENENAKSLDLIWGADAISAVIGCDRRRTFYLLEQGEIPAKKVGGRWVIERGKLLRFFREDAA